MQKSVKGVSSKLVSIFITILLVFLFSASIARGEVILSEQQVGIQQEKQEEISARGDYTRINLETGEAEHYTVATRLSDSQERSIGGMVCAPASSPTAQGRFVFGNDTRFPVPSSLLTESPYESIGIVSSLFLHYDEEDNLVSFTRNGTGFLFAKNAVMTNAHAVYDSENQVYATTVTFYPAYQEDIIGIPITPVYTAEHVNVSSYYPLTL
ncbi:MAG: hypothetical protein FWD27_08050 [Coriobacteriia bacterium]|nr:hypothetical protein [Coriobacteriia bacterium]